MDAEKLGQAVVDASPETSKEFVDLYIEEHGGLEPRPTWKQLVAWVGKFRQDVMSAASRPTSSAKWN